MQLIVPDPSYARESEVDRGQFLSDLEAHLREIFGDVSLRDSDIGRGADWPVIVATLSGLFLLGKPINENVEARIGLSRKFGRLLKWVLSKCVAYRVDAAGANLLAINSILHAEEEPISSIELAASAFIPFWTNPLRDPAGLDHHPDGLFAKAFVVNGRRIYILGIKSNGSIESRGIHPVQACKEF